MNHIWFIFAFYSMPLNRIAHAARTALIACNLAVFAALAAPALVAAQDGPGQQAASVHRLADVPYGPHPLQRMDVYLPARAATANQPAPVILMVHGGAWSAGDKARGGVVREKVARWVERGFVLISVNYRLHPAVDVYRQAQDVAGALAEAQRRAAAWGGDPSRFILMGHSAGAHLVALVNASPALVRQADVPRPWLGAVALDSAALDVPALMAAPHARFYDRVFGADPDFWRRVSPLHALDGTGAGALRPFQLVCSTERAQASCGPAEAMARRVQALGRRAEVLPQALSHGEINAQLGRESGYTQAVERFMASLDAQVARMLGF